MGLQNTARHRAMVSARTIRRARRQSGLMTPPARRIAALHVFVTKLDQFLGAELLAADQPVIIGRHRDAHLRLATANVSREHLRLTLEDGKVFVEDLGSANGTLVNRKRIRGKVELRTADTLQVGPYTLRVRPLLPAVDRDGSGLSDADTAVDAVLAATGSQGTEDDVIEVPSAIDWRVYEDAIRRATGAEPPKNVIVLKRQETATRPSEPMDEEEPSEQVQTAPAQETQSTFLNLLRGVSNVETPAVTPGELAVASRLDELRKLIDRMGSVDESQREPTKPERRISELLQLGELPEIQEEDLIWSEADEVIEMSAFSDAFAVVPQERMANQDPAEASTASREELPGLLEVEDPSTASARSMPRIEEPTGATDVRHAERRYDSAPMSSEAIARSLLRPAGAPERSTRDGRATPSRPATAPRAEAPAPRAPSPWDSSVAIIPVRPTPEPPKPAPRASSAPARRVASIVISDESLRAEREHSGLRPLPRARVAGPEAAKDPSPARGTPVAPKSRPTPAPVPAERAVSAVLRAVPSPSSAKPSAPPRPSLPPPPPPTPRAKPILVQLPSAKAGASVTLSPPESQRGSGRVRISPVSELIAPPPPALPEGTLTEEIAADTAFDAVEITARSGEQLLDISILRREGEQYVLGHATPQGARAPASAHPGLRLLRIDGSRNVDLVFPRDVGGQLVRNGETVTLHELTENRNYSCLRLRARDVVTVLLGKGPTKVSYHIRFVRAPRSISAARAARPA